MECLPACPHMNLIDNFWSIIEKDVYENENIKQISLWEVIKSNVSDERAETILKINEWTIDGVQIDILR